MKALARTMAGVRLATLGGADECVRPYIAWFNAVFTTVHLCALALAKAKLKLQFSGGHQMMYRDAATPKAGSHPRGRVSTWPGNF